MPVFEPVELGDRAVLERALQAVERPFEPVEAPVDALPARGDEIDEEREILDAGAPLGLDVGLDVLQAADRLVREAANLGEAPRDRRGLGAHPVADRGVQPVRDGRLEPGGLLRERLERLACALERRVERRRVGAAAGLVEAAAGACERLG